MALKRGRRGGPDAGGGALRRVLENVQRGVVSLEPAQGAHFFNRQEFLQTGHDAAGVHGVGRNGAIAVIAVAQMQTQSEQCVGAFGLAVGLP